MPQKHTNSFQILSFGLTNFKFSRSTKGVGYLKFREPRGGGVLRRASISLAKSFEAKRRAMSDTSSHSSSSSSNSRRVTKLTREGKVPASYFMDDLNLAEEPHPGNKMATTMKILAAVLLVAVILAGVAMTLYHKEAQEFAKKRMAVVENVWANTDLTKYKTYFSDFFTWKRNQKYEVEVTPNTDGLWIMNLLRGKKKFNIKLTPA